MELTSITVPLTPDNLPPMPLWEEDGSCWRAIKCDPREVGCDWRWQPMNWAAFGKGEPTSEMTDIPPGAFKNMPVTAPP